MRIAVTGATGLVGRALTGALRERGDEVVAFSRDPERAAGSLPEGVLTARWDPSDTETLAADLTGADAVVNLAGEPVLGRRWNAKVREAIRASRVDGTRAVVEAMSAASDPPGILVNASAVGYYGARGGERFGEDEPPGGDFLAEVCVEWEATAREAEPLGVRVVSVRIGIVLAKEGGALAKMLPPFRWFVGGKIGNGRQGFPWIHIDDLTGIILHALGADDLRGPVNATAPEPLENRAFCRVLGKVLRRPSWLPVPRLMLRLLMGPAAAVLVKGQMAIPERIRSAGYRFRFEDAEAALRDLLGR
jgi:uncharacterized protein (TIGR01777 family)